MDQLLKWLADGEAASMEAAQEAAQAMLQAQILSVVDSNDQNGRHVATYFPRSRASHSVPSAMIYFAS